MLGVTNLGARKMQTWRLPTRRNPAPPNTAPQRGGTIRSDASQDHGVELMRVSVPRRDLTNVGECTRAEQMNELTRNIRGAQLPAGGHRPFTAPTTHWRKKPKQGSGGSERFAARGDGDQGKPPGGHGQ